MTLVLLVLTFSLRAVLSSCSQQPVASIQTFLHFSSLLTLAASVNGVEEKKVVKTPSTGSTGFTGSIRLGFFFLKRSKHGTYLFVKL